MSISIVATENAPAALGPYSQGVKVGNLLFCSGSIPAIPKTGEIVTGSITEQTKQAFSNMKAVCISFFAFIILYSFFIFNSV